MAELELTRTRRALHGVAELVLAGPQYRRSDTIHLRPVPGGFGTVALPDLQVDGTDLVTGATRLPMAGTTYAALAAAAGVEAAAPGVYEGGSGVRVDEVITLDPDVTIYLAGCYALGEAALRRLAPDETPVLWPEHFDLAITVDAVNYGVSPGDTWLDEPYAYVGPWERRTGDFWTAPFGAAVPLRQFPSVDELLSFLAEGRDRAHRDPVAGSA